MLITGIAGVAGFNAFHYFKAKYGDRVIGVRPVNNWPLSGPGIIGCDVENELEIRKLIEEHEIRSVLNSGGSCKLKACEYDPQMAHRVNVRGIESLLGVIKEKDLPLVHLSIDLVYSGKSGQGGYVETDATDPVTVYGKTMVRAEDLIADHRPDATVLRISLPMGISFNGHAGAIDWIQSRFIKDKPATLYFDEVRTPTYVECLNEVIEECFERRLAGVFHAGGSLKWSLYEIAQIVNRIGGYDPNLLIGCPRLEAGPMPPRAGNVTMDSSKLCETLGRDPFEQWPLNEIHRPDTDDWHFDRSNGQGHSDWIEKYLYRRSEAPRR